MTSNRSLFTLAFCVVAAPLAAQEPTNLTLGVYSFKKPTDVVRDFAAATDELSRLATQEAKRPVSIRLRVFKTYDECVDKFVAGDVDLVRFGPASYVVARQRNPQVQLLVAEQEDGKKRCEGVIAVRADSGVKTLGDLAGKTFAFGDEMSTIGRYLSQAQLVKAGITAESLRHYRYLERHDKVFKAVEAGEFDAGAMHIATFEDLNEKQQLRMVVKFENVGKPWVVRAGLDAPTVTALRQALLAMKNEPALKALKVHGFLPASDDDYQLVRTGMKDAAAFVRAPAAQPAKD
jgi:phosphonate transport system substrate-binding protein